MPETPQSRTLFDFGAGTEPWRSIDDGVMGGVSRSEMAVADGTAVFRGEVSLESGGGFASVRSAPEPRDLSAFDGVKIRVRGDGRRYKLRLRDTAGFDGVNHQATFEPPEGEWVTLRFPFSDFAPVFRGRPVPDAPPLDPGRVHTFGFLISDRQAGPFRLQIDSVAAYRESGR